MVLHGIFEASESDWTRFSTVLEGISRNFEEETKNENVETKLAKVYENIERATGMVFKKKADFEDKTVDDDAKKKSNNKIPKRIRTLMKRKKKLSKNILARLQGCKMQQMTALRGPKPSLPPSYPT